jgi:PTH1 family peptidyl-tRNA hydrolase
MIFNKSKPYLIVGLGNPGREYSGSRHNVGFMVVDRLAEKLETSFRKVKMNALITAVRHNGERIIMIKPQTFMNLSGQAVSSFIRFYKLPLENVLVVYDDVDLPFETLRLKPDGGDAGQRGVRSIIQQLGTKSFPRLRVGIDRPPGRMEVSDYVLQKFSAAEKGVLPFILDTASGAVLHFIDHGLNQAMTIYNQNPSQK